MVLFPRITGKMMEYEFEGATENAPLFIDVNEVTAIVRVLSDETEQIKKERVNGIIASISSMARELCGKIEWA